MRSRLCRLACSFLCCGGPPRDGIDEDNSSLRWVFTISELQSATNNFNYDNKIGVGQFGSVYWGQLWDRSQIAVKRLTVLKNKNDHEFIADVEILSKVRHANILSLRGYCVDEQERILVYDYMPNLSVYAHLHGLHAPECLLDWDRRISIAVGAANGIKFLHHNAAPQIIHTSIKASNILLDADFQVQIADAGLAALWSDKTNHHKGLQDSQSGYLAPEYILHGTASTSSDAYSFGIFLIELASGKKPIEKPGAEKSASIRVWALQLARENRFDLIADSRLNGKYVEGELKKVVLVGLLCTRREPKSRPTMLEVVSLLTGNSKQMLSKLESNDLLGEGSDENSSYTSTASENEPLAVSGR